MDDITFDTAGLPYSPRYDDHYFSRHDGQAETAHVFLAGNGLPARWAAVSHFSIGELGFGTGLNFLETWRSWRDTRQDGQRLTFTSLDAHMLPVEAATEALARWTGLAPLSDCLLTRWADLTAGVSLDDQTVLQVIDREALAALNAFPAEIDAWYLDGFAPANNPAMWSAPLMAALAARTAPDGTFASYTAAGWVRRNLQEAGFHVDRKPGFGHKRHMICGHLA